MNNVIDFFEARRRLRGFDYDAFDRLAERQRQRFDRISRDLDQAEQILSAIEQIVRVVYKIP